MSPQNPAPQNPDNSDLASGTVGSTPVPTPSSTASGNDDLSSGIVGTKETDEPDLYEPSNPSSIPNARIRNLPNPARHATSAVDAALDGAETGLLAASIPGAVFGVNEVAGAVEKGGKALIPALTRGVTAIGEWAEAHPITAKLIYEGIKGATWYKILKRAVD